MSYDVVELIRNDHREVERLFEELRTNPASRPGVLPLLTTLLTAHSRAEEGEVYPAAAAAGGGDEVAHSQEEHVECDRLLAELAQTDPESPDFASKLGEVVEKDSHHINEEETTVLPGIAERIDEARRAELGDAFLAARAEHLGDQPDDITKADLEQQASNAGITGVSDLDKAGLQQELRRQSGA